MRVLLIFLILTLPKIAQAEKVQPPKIPLIIDSDADLDDMMGIFFLLSSKKINLLAITTTSNGMSHYKFGARNLLNFLKLANNPEIPVTESKKYPIAPNGTYPTEWREKVDLVNDIKLPHNVAYPEGIDSVDFMIERILSHETKVRILCTGPLTNLALALIKEPAIKRNIERVYIVGGAINVRGNLLGKHNGYVNRSAEYNFFIDAKAADIVFHSELPLTLIPLDALPYIESLPIELYRTLVKSRRGAFAEFVFQNLNPFLNYKQEYEPSFLSVLAAGLILNDSIANVLNINLSINLDFGPYYGTVSIDRLGAPVDVCFSINYLKFYNLFLSSMIKE